VRELAARVSLRAVFAHLLAPGSGVRVFVTFAAFAFLATRLIGACEPTVDPALAPAVASHATATASGVGVPEISGAPARPVALTPSTPPAAAERIAVRVNARPWARVRVNGVALGSTPLTHELEAGVYEFEAEFSDGRRVRRRIEVSSEQRFVALR
jgi:hypothetical protein